MRPTKYTEVRSVLLEGDGLAGGHDAANAFDHLTITLNDGTELVVSGCKRCGVLFVNQLGN